MLCPGVLSAPDQAAHNMPSPADDPAAAILDLLLDEHPGLLHIDELVRLYASGSLEPAEAARIVDDALSELLAGGLAHRLERFVLASRAARRCRDFAR